MTEVTPYIQKSNICQRYYSTQESQYRRLKRLPVRSGHQGLYPSYQQGMMSQGLRLEVGMSWLFWINLDFVTEVVEWDKNQRLSVRDPSSLVTGAASYIQRYMTITLPPLLFHHMQQLNASLLLRVDAVSPSWAHCLSATLSFVRRGGFWRALQGCSRALSSFVDIYWRQGAHVRGGGAASLPGWDSMVSSPFVSSVLEVLRVWRF